MALDVLRIRALCEGREAYRTGTGYARARVACEVLAELGEKIPSWMQIREVTGKGSSGDINRAIRDTRAELQERLRQVTGPVAVAGMPEAVQAHVRALWEAAVASVKADFDGNVRQWTEQIEQANERAEDAVTKAEQAKRLVEQLHLQLEAAAERDRFLQTQVGSEKAAREQAERMLQTQALEAASERAGMRHALDEAQKQVAAAIERLEGVQRHALRQVEDIRAQGERDKEELRRARAAAEKDAGKARADLGIAEQRLNASKQQQGDLRQEVVELRKALERERQRMERMAYQQQREVGQRSVGDRATLSTLARRAKRAKVLANRIRPR